MQRIADGMSKMLSCKYCLVILDESHQEVYDATSQSVAGIVQAVRFGEAMIGWSSISQSRMQALALERNQTQEFGDLEHPEKVAACKEMFRALVGDHRKLYPSLEGRPARQSYTMLASPDSQLMCHINALLSNLNCS
jgi:hypothetical protein